MGSLGSLDSVVGLQLQNSWGNAVSTFEKFIQCFLGYFWLSNQCFDQFHVTIELYVRFFSVPKFYQSPCRLSWAFHLTFLIHVTTLITYCLACYLPFSSKDSKDILHYTLLFRYVL